MSTTSPFVPLWATVPEWVWTGLAGAAITLLAQMATRYVDNRRDRRVWSRDAGLRAATDFLAACDGLREAREAHDAGRLPAEAPADASAVANAHAVARDSLPAVALCFPDLDAKIFGYFKICDTGSAYSERFKDQLAVLNYELVPGLPCHSLGPQQLVASHQSGC